MSRRAAHHAVWRGRAMLCLALGGAAGAQAHPPQAVETAASAVVHRAERVQDTVVHAVGRAASAAGHGIHRAGQAVSKTTKKLGLPAGASAPEQP